MSRGRAAAMVGLPSLALLLIGALVLLAGRRHSPPDVVLISLDTLRRDAVGVYAAGAPSSTPAIDGFARESLVFERAFTPMPFTLSAHMTMFTGLPPWAHGVVRDDDRLGERLATLPERMRAAGYRTLGFYTNDYLDGGFGFARGFDRYEEVRHALTTAEPLTDRALASVEWRNARRAPVFLFLHYYEAHSEGAEAGNRLPYYVPPAFRGGLTLSEDGAEFCDARGRCATDFLVAADQERRTLAPAVVETLEGLYHGGVRYLDSQLARLFQGLREQGVLERAVVVVTSDHGEEFREHGSFLHSRVYEETLAVPLIVHLPGGARGGERRQELVELSDLLPTLLGAIGHRELTPAGVEGRDLLAASPAARRALLSRDKERPNCWALRTDRYKLIDDHNIIDPELYDLASDPAERHDLGKLRRDLSDPLDQQLLAELSRIRPPTWRDPGSHVLTDEQKERLRSVGYLR